MHERLLPERGLLLAGCALAVLAFSRACAAADAAAGAVVFDTYCSTCHGPAINNFNSILLGANNPGLIQNQIQRPGSIMGFLQNIVTASDIANVAAYLGTVGAAPPLPPAPPAAATTPIVEYYHPEFDHYFITGIAAEISALDTGKFAGWQRTGQSFNAYASPTATSASVCRFFSSAFAPKSSHFYTPFASECGIVKTNANWSFEGEVFAIDVPDATGACAPGTLPVYRLYNNGQGGAPNHRYTTDLGVRSAMIAKGWVPEGSGDLGVIMCSP